MSEILLQTKALTKQYGHQKAVDNVDIHIKKGAIYGFIGRNGAGKTTCMRMIGGLAKPTSGEISMFGYAGKDLSKVRSRVGCLIEAPGVYPNMTAKENIEMKCRLFGISKKGYAEGILDKVGLLNVGKKKTKNFSLGMKQRLGIGMALVGEPDLLVLDEPINGLDPQGIAEIRDTLKRLNQKKGITILISSHILEELYKVADTFGIINQGELILATDTQGDINGDGKITYIMCKGDPENIDAQYRTEYSIKALTDAGKEVECLYEFLDNWDQTTAQQDVANALSQYGEKIEVVFCNNDAMALGALQSLQQAGRTVGKDVYLVGVDALVEAVQNVVDGNMTGTVLNDDVGQATKAAEATKLFVEGKDVEKYYWVDYVKVTKDNASQYLKED